MHMNDIARYRLKSTLNLISKTATNHHTIDIAKAISHIRTIGNTQNSESLSKELDGA